MARVLSGGGGWQLWNMRPYRYRWDNGFDAGEGIIGDFSLCPWDVVMFRVHGPLGTFYGIANDYDDARNKINASQFMAFYITEFPGMSVGEVVAALM